MAKVRLRGQDRIEKRERRERARALKALWCANMECRQPFYKKRSEPIRWSYCPCCREKRFGQDRIRRAEAEYRQWGAAGKVVA